MPVIINSDDDEKSSSSSPVITQDSSSPQLTLPKAPGRLTPNEPTRATSNGTNTPRLSFSIANILSKNNSLKPESKTGKLSSL